MTLAKKLVAEEGFLSLYKGLDSSLMRQATYTTTRLGIYRSLFNKREEFYNGPIPLHEKVLITLFAGFSGAVVGNPADLILIRFQNDETLPKNLRRNYKNFPDAFIRIIREEGFFALWKGSTPTIARAMSLNLGQLCTFEQLKDSIAKRRDGKYDFFTRLVAVTGSGLVSSFMSLPFDNVKTKLQKQGIVLKITKNQGLDEDKIYRSFFDCVKKSVKREGILGLWVGFPTYLARIAPHSMISLLVMDWFYMNLGKGTHKK